MPLSLISLMRLPGFSVASRWNVYWLAPAAAMGFTQRSGCATIMCMSATLTVSHCGSTQSVQVGFIMEWRRLFSPKKGSWPISFLRHSTMGWPNVRFGTKCLQMETQRQDISAQLHDSLVNQQSPNLRKLRELRLKMFILCSLIDEDKMRCKDVTCLTAFQTGDIFTSRPICLNKRK